MKCLVQAIMIVGVCTPLTPAMGQAPTDPVAVEPAELDRREDLVGREVVVDDHVRYYVPRTGTEPDELQLKRTPITFEVPRRLRPVASTRLSAAIIRGVLRREGSRLVCGVTEIQPVGGDLDRLETGLKSLAAKDFEGRKTWVQWAERRSKDFKDSALSVRARALEGEALRIESDMKRLGVDAPREWLTMAQEARRRRVPEPEPSALGHRAFKTRLTAATTVAELTALIKEINEFFPKAAGDLASARLNLARWEGPYGDDPAGTYRAAPSQIREALTRRIWADATARLLELQASEDLNAALAAADRAAAAVPEKTTLPAQLIDNAATAARRDLPNLRLSEVKALAAVYREKLQQPGPALEILGEWLRIRQKRLSATDAEGPLELANLYEELIQDRVTAVELLRKAWRIDPSSKEIAEAFRSRGFRKAKDEWIEPALSPPNPAAATAGAPTARPPSTAQGLRGLTGDEVRTRLGGKPDRVNYVATRGELIEQWIYHLDNKKLRFVNLLRSPGELKPRVIADYTIPSSSLKGGTQTVR
jgi:tetratricopeptide (TPR) repeat protein